MRALVHKLNSYKLALETQSKKQLHLQKQLSSSEKKYHTLFKAAPFPYLVLSKIGIIRDTNQAFIKLMGIHQATPLNKPFLEFAVPECHDIFHEHFRKVLKTKSKQSCKLELLRTSKAPLYVHMESVYLQRKGEASSEICTAMIDITAQAEMDKNLTRYCSSLEDMIKHSNQELQKARKELKDLRDS